MIQCNTYCGIYCNPRVENTTCCVQHIDNLYHIKLITQQKNNIIQSLSTNLSEKLPISEHSQLKCTCNKHRKIKKFLIPPVLFSVIARYCQHGSCALAVSAKKCKTTSHSLEMWGDIVATYKLVAVDVHPQHIRATFLAEVSHVLTLFFTFTYKSPLCVGESWSNRWAL